MHRGLTERYGLLKVDAAGIGFCVVVSLVFHGLVVQPFLQRQAAAGRQCHEVKVRQEKAAELKVVLGRTQERLAGAQAELAAGTIQLEPMAHINKRVARLTQLFAACDLEVDDIQTGRVSHGSQYDMVPITVAGRGFYKQCVRLLHELHSACPDMSVAGIEVAANPGRAAEKATVQVDFIWCAAPGGPGLALGVTGDRPYVIPER